MAKKSGKPKASALKGGAMGAQAGKRVAELVWATVLGMAATGDVLAAVRAPESSGADGRLPLKEADLLALAKSGGAHAMAEATAAMGTVLDQIPQEIIGLIREALGDLDATEPADAAEPASEARSDAANENLPSAFDVVTAQEQIHVAAADDDGMTLSDAGGGLWNASDPIILADAGTTATGASAGQGAAAETSAAAAAFDPSILGLLGVGALAAAAGGGGSGGSSTGETSALTTAPATISTLSGKVIDGYVVGAKVFVDADNDGVLDQDELSTTTDGSGSFNLTGSMAAGAKVIVEAGGVNAGLGGSNTGTLAKMNTSLSATVDASGHIVVSPLTTLLASNPSLTESALKASLGIDDSVNLSSYDAVAAINAGGADAGTAQVVFAKAQQVMTLLQTSVASGVTMDQAVSAISSGIASSAAGQGLEVAVSNVVDQIASTSSAFSGATQKAALANSITAINQSIETAYGNLAEAVQSGDSTAVAQALASTAVAQTDFLDAIVNSAEAGVATGVAQFGNATQLASFVSNAQSNIVGNVQKLDVESLATLQAASVDLSAAKIDIVVNDAQDAALLSQTLSNLSASNIGGLSLDTTISDLHDQIMQTLATGGLDTSQLSVATGHY